MYNKKVVMAVAGIAALLMLFAGVGYAAFAGNARTYNEDNTATLAYVTASPANFDPIANDIEVIFDTYAYGSAFNAVASPEEASLANYWVLNLSGKFVKAEAPFDAENHYYTKDIAGSTQLAYAFNSGETLVDPAITIDATTYVAVSLGSKDVVIDNHSGAAINKLDIVVKATEDVGTADFVYIFEFVNSTNKVYAVFNEADDVTAQDLTVSIADGSTTTVNINLYIAYVTNVYVNTDFIGAVSATQTDYYANPYIHAAAGPANLNASFGFEFVDDSS